jgi:hypothetical protein
LIGVKLYIIGLLSLASLITSITITSVGNNEEGKLALEIFLTCVCGSVNLAVVYGSTFDSRKNFILREQIEMQTNQTNDIWTILVP